MRSLVEVCDAQHIEIYDESAIQRFELLLGDELLDELRLPEEAQEAARQPGWPPVIELLGRLSRDVGIMEAMGRSANACAAHNLPRLLARCRALYCDPRAALQPDDELLLHVRTTGVVQLPELAWPPAPAPSPPSALDQPPPAILCRQPPSATTDQPLPPMLRLQLVDCVGKRLERNKLLHSLDASVHLACFVASLSSLATTSADGGAVGLAATADLLEAFYRRLAARAPRARLLIVLTQRDALVEHIARVGAGRWEELWPTFARDLKLDALGGQHFVHPADVAARYFARELVAAVNRARSSDTPEAAARHRNIAPRVVGLHSALDLADVRDRLWPDQLAIELLGGWSAVFTPAATRGMLDEAQAEPEAQGGSDSSEEEDDLLARRSSGAAAKPTAAVAMPSISERFARLWRAVGT